MSESGQIALETVLPGQELPVAQTVSDVKINMTSPKRTAVTAAFQRPCEYGGRTKRMPLLHLCGIVIRFLKRQLLGVF